MKKALSQPACAFILLPELPCGGCVGGRSTAVGTET